jgi:acyl-CoA reductase-like NAD-dependent aldehyde dehydrogenase
MSEPIAAPAAPVTDPANPQTQPPVVPSAAFTQDQFNAAIAEEKRKWKQQQTAEVAEAARKAAETEAAAKGEFEKLATERGTRLQALEAEHTTTTTRADALATAMEAQIKARIKALPDELRDLLVDGDVLTRYEQLGKLEAAAAKLVPAAPAPRRDSPSGPRGPGSGPTPQSNNADLIAEKRAQVGGI